VREAALRGTLRHVPESCSDGELSATQPASWVGGSDEDTSDALTAPLPWCDTPWDLYSGRWVRTSPAADMFHRSMFAPTNGVMLFTDMRAGVQWVPYRCRRRSVHDPAAAAAHVQQWLRGKRLLYTGDSHVREVFHATLQRVCGVTLRRQSFNATRGWLSEMEPTPADTATDGAAGSGGSDAGTGTRNGTRRVQPRNISLTSVCVSEAGGDDVTLSNVQEMLPPLQHMMFDRAVETATTVIVGTALHDRVTNTSVEVVQRPLTCSVRGICFAGDGAGRWCPVVGDGWSGSGASGALPNATVTVADHDANPDAELLPSCHNWTTASVAGGGMHVPDAVVLNVGHHPISGLFRDTHARFSTRVKQFLFGVPGRRTGVVTAALARRNVTDAEVDTAKPSSVPSGDVPRGAGRRGGGRAPRQPVVWMESLPMPMRNDRVIHSFNDGRSSQRLRLFNDVAEELWMGRPPLSHSVGDAVCTALTADYTRAHFVSRLTDSEVDGAADGAADSASGGGADSAAASAPASTASRLLYMRTAAIANGVMDWCPDIAHLTGLTAAQDAIDEVLLAALMLPDL
jgi:hypothetical protein